MSRLNISIYRIKQKLKVELLQGNVDKVFIKETYAFLQDEVFGIQINWHYVVNSSDVRKLRLFDGTHQKHEVYYTNLYDNVYITVRISKTFQKILHDWTLKVYIKKRLLSKTGMVLVFSIKVIIDLKKTISEIVH